MFVIKMKNFVIKSVMGGLGLLVSTGMMQGAESFTYWSMWNAGEPQQKVLERAIDAFQQETGIEVKVQWVGRDNLKKLSPTLNSAITAVDLVDGAQRNLRSILVSTQNASNLEEVYAAKIFHENQTIADVIPQKYTDLVRVDGYKWLVPYELITAGWWYNAALLPELEKQAPENWQDFIVLLDQLKARNIEPLALDGDISHFNLYYFAEIAVRHLGPGKLLEAVKDETGNALKDPAILATASQIEQLVTQGYFATNYNASKWPAMQHAWASNKAGLILNGPWVVSEAAGYAVDDFTPRFFAMPSMGEKSHASQEVSFIGFSIPQKAQNREAAQKFIAYFMGKKWLEAIAQETNNLVPRADIAVPQPLIAAKQATEDSLYVHNQFDGLIDWEADYTSKILSPLVNELIFGVKDAQTFQEELVKNTINYRRYN